MGELALNYEAAPPPLVNLIIKLMMEEELSSFILAGGTALALQFGHRISVDIDLFSNESFDTEPVANLLIEKYSIQSLEISKNTIRGEVKGIKLDVLSHQYPMIENSVSVDRIRMVSLKDIAAMKLNAISNRGSKKDFWDYAELLNYFSRDEMLGFFAEKYTNENVWYVEKSLCYFEDAEEEPDPRDLKGQSWDNVKQIVLDSNRL